MQFIPIHSTPLYYVTQSAARELPFNYAGMNINGDFVFALLGVKVRRSRVIPEHGDDDPQKSTNDWHG